MSCQRLALGEQLLGNPRHLGFSVFLSGRSGLYTLTSGMRASVHSTLDGFFCEVKVVSALLSCCLSFPYHFAGVSCVLDVRLLSEHMCCGYLLSVGCLFGFLMSINSQFNLVQFIHFFSFCGECLLCLWRNPCLLQGSKDSLLISSKCMTGFFHSIFRA